MKKGINKGKRKKEKGKRKNEKGKRIKELIGEVESSGTDQVVKDNKDSVKEWGRRQMRYQSECRHTYVPMSSMMHAKALLLASCV